jgi:transposase
VNDFYETATDDDAERKLNELIEEFRTSHTDEMKHFAGTLRKWQEEILNSLKVYGYVYKVDRKTGQLKTHQLRVTNAIIENRNAICKCIKKNANGYKNWDRFRNRLMYVLDKDSTFFLNPISKHDKKNSH